MLTIEELAGVPLLSTLPAGKLGEVPIALGGRRP
jgi:hypothetical protein